jgi:hypothetical protein
MPKKRISSLLVISLLFGGLFVLSNTAAASAAVFVPVSGTDSTNGSESALTTSSNGDMFKLSASDDKRMASNIAWPGIGLYDELKYLEFVFSPDIPNDAVISLVTLTHEYRRNAILSAAKLEIWDGNIWQDISLNLPDAIATDISETKDISSITSTPATVNGLKIRFLAYRDTVATSATTSHDLIQLVVNYSSSTTPTPAPSETSTPEITPTPEPSDTPTATPTPLETPIPSPTSLIIATFSPTPIPLTAVILQNNQVMPTPTVPKLIQPSPKKTTALLNVSVQTQTNESLSGHLFQISSATNIIRQLLTKFIQMLQFRQGGNR